MSRGGLGLGQDLTLGAHGQLQAELHAEKGTQSPLEPQPRALSVHVESHQPTATSLQLQGPLGAPCSPRRTGPATALTPGARDGGAGGHHSDLAGTLS